MTLVLESSAIKGGYLEDKYGICTRDADDIAEGVPQRSFPLRWGNVPDGTESLSLVFIDYDNVKDEGVPWIHWLVAGISADIRFIDENISRSEADIIQGRNSWAMPYAPYGNISEDIICHYGGPAPTGIHKYELTLFALDRVSDLHNGFYYNEMRDSMTGHIIEKQKISMYYDGRR